MAALPKQSPAKSPYTWAFRRCVMRLRLYLYLQFVFCIYMYLQLHIADSSIHTNYNVLTQTQIIHIQTIIQLTNYKYDYSFLRIATCTYNYKCTYKLGGSSLLLIVISIVSVSAMAINATMQHLRFSNVKKRKCLRMATCTYNYKSTYKFGGPPSSLL